MITLLKAAQERLVRTLFIKSQINYDAHYIQLYSSFNAWYRVATGQHIDALALATLRDQTPLWADMFNDHCLQQLRSVMRRLYVLTTHRPLQSDSAWAGSLRDETDWSGMIEFWYAVRCTVVHGGSQTLNAYHDLYVRLAYESLQSFMTEVVGRAAVQQQPHMQALPLTSKRARQLVYSATNLEVHLQPVDHTRTLFALREESD